MSTHDTHRICRSCGATETNGSDRSACCDAPTTPVRGDSPCCDTAARRDSDAFLVADVVEILEAAGWADRGERPGGRLLSSGRIVVGGRHHAVLRMTWTGLEAELHGSPVARTRLAFNPGAPAGRIARAIIALTTDEGDDG